MANVAEYESAGVPSRQLGWSYTVWNRTDLVTIINHFGISVNLNRHSSGSKLALLHRLDILTQEHGLTVRDRRLILEAKERDPALAPNGPTRLEGAHRRAWERRLRDVANGPQRTSRGINVNVQPNSGRDGRLPAVFSRIPAPTTPGNSRLSTISSVAPRIPARTTSVNSRPATSSSVAPRMSALTAPVRSELPMSFSVVPGYPALTLPIFNRPATSSSVASRIPARTSSSSVAPRNLARTTSSSLVPRIPARTTSMNSQPATSSSAVSGPAIDTSASSSNASDNPTIRLTKRDCSICLESQSLQRFPNRSITSACNHAPDVCLTCLATSIETQISSKLWDQIDCPMCSQRLQYTDVKKFASSVVFGRYV